ncbi:MAG TPA: ABC transporter ATP-binding protein, partial [Candidatus Edwardsbacteria bacterium]|nr:ABC transporter ATP-binding protein [Candidatus Edwardsbacteria bacterium]
DEPFSSIDGPTRVKVRECLTRVIHTLGIPVILVTHDLIEAVSSGDRLVIYDQGRVIQQGTPAEVLQNPVSDEVQALTFFETHTLVALKGAMG